jgi:hypothetical protein
MGLSGFIRGGMSVLVGILSLYILENTFGTAMDSMYLSFYNLAHSLPLPPAWRAISIGVLGGWVWFNRAFVIAIIAIFVWLGSLIFVDNDYSKQRGG